MLDKNGLPLQFPPSAFSAFPIPGLDPRTAAWSHPALQSQHGHTPQSAAAAMGLSDGGAAALLGLPPPHPLSPTYLSALHHHISPQNSLRFGDRLPSHQDYLNAAAQRLGELQATAAFQANAAAMASAVDPLNSFEGSRFASLSRANRKRALSASPYSELDLSALIRYSPTSLHFLNGSPASSGSYGHLSTGALSPALVHSAHLQQLHAHLIRSASASPFLSPQNSLQNSLIHLQAAAQALQHHPSSQASQQHSYMPLLGVTPSSTMLTPNHTNTATTVMSHLSISNEKSEHSHHHHHMKESKENHSGTKHPEPCSNVVSSTMEDEDSREGILAIKDEPGLSLTSHYHPHKHGGDVLLGSHHRGNTGSRPSSQHQNVKSTSQQQHHQMMKEMQEMKDGDMKEEVDFIETHCHWIGCDRDFGTQDQLVKHLNNDHIGVNKKAFVCQWKECCREEKPFKAQYMLVVHMRRHTGEKPHRCTFENCNKAYSRLENLKTHLRSHTGEKPYACEFPGCTKAFSNASDRAKHQNRTHSNEKPYACRAPGCTKRYTDPSSLRKHVKTVHGAEFYASKRHKGMSNTEDRSEDGASWCQPNTPRTPHSVSTTKSDMANSPAPSSPPEERGTGPGGSTGKMSSGKQRQVNSSGYLPLSDSNVSTTHQDSVANWNTDDINMAVAAAIGVCSDDMDCGPGHSGPGNNLSNRLANKLKSDRIRQTNSPAVLGDINRSIEKMSLGNGNKARTGQTSLTSYNNRSMCSGTMAGGQTLPTATPAVAVMNNSNVGRRDSNWTTSTEGYGSMRSEQSMQSRRCSDISAMSQGSNISMRAQMNSPWDPISADSSRRSSLAGQEGTALPANPISHHLSRLHRKAQTTIQQQQQQTPSATPTPQQNAMSSHDMSRMQAMQHQQHPHMMQQHHQQQQQQQQQQQTRRASDPVRTLDRNFGVGGGQLSRHQRSGSFNQINNLGCNNQMQQQRVPLHGQRVRGHSTAGVESQQNYFQQNGVNQTMMYGHSNGNVAAPNNGNVPFNNGQLTAPNTFQTPYIPTPTTTMQQQQQQQFAAPQQQGMWPQQHQQQQPGYYYNGTSSSVGPFNASGQYGPNTTPVNSSIPQWNPQAWNSWQQQQQQQQQAPLPQQQQQPAMVQQPQQATNMNGVVASAAGPGAAVTAVKRCDDSYQRTFDYVQQCQNWATQQ